DTGMITGTIPYMAPEQLRGEPPDRRSDIYSAGVILYEMATGRLPYDSEVVAALIGEILHREPPSPARVNPSISARLDRAVVRALEKEPRNRFQSARDFEEHLSVIQDASRRRVRAGPFRWKWALPGVALALGAVLLLREAGWIRGPWGAAGHA